MKNLVLPTIILLLLFCSSVALADKPFKVSVDRFLRGAICDAGIEKAILLSSGVSKPILIALPELAGTPVVSSSIVCERLLYELNKEEGWFKRNILFEFTPYSQREGALWRESTGELLTYCLKAGLCSRGIIDHFGLKPVLRRCTGRQGVVSMIKRAKPRILKTSVEKIKNVDLILHPHYPFSYLVEEMLEKPELKTLTVSTMSMGGGALKDLLNKVNATGKQLNLLYDYGLATFDASLDFLPEYATRLSSFNPVPITAGNYFKNIYHIKYAISPDVNEALLTGANLSTAENTEYLDVVYKFSDQQVVDELIALSVDQINNQCGAKKDVECLTEFLPPEHNAKSIFTAFIKRSCIASRQNKTNIGEYKARFFANSYNSDLERLISNFIDLAKTEVLLISHQFSSPVVAKALDRARSRNVDLHVITAFPSPVLRQLQIPYYSSGVGEIYPYPHLKLIAVDKSELLFGTGNFTINALRNAAELFAITNDKSAISKVRDIYADLLQSFDIKKSRKISPAEKPEQWVILTGDGTPTSIPFTIKSDKPWKQRYLKVEPAGRDMLGRCGLLNLSFINDNLYLDCIKE